MVKSHAAKGYVKVDKSDRHQSEIYGMNRVDNKRLFKTNISPHTILKFNAINPRAKCKVHPTQKPVALLEYLIKTYTMENETVLDFTMGSGSTGVACQNLNRKFIGIEKDEKYLKITEHRLSQKIEVQEAMNV